MMNQLMSFTGKFTQWSENVVSTSACMHASSEMGNYNNNNNADNF